MELVPSIKVLVQAILSGIVSKDNPAVEDARAKMRVAGLKIFKIESSTDCGWIKNLLNP
ncbi:MAG: hypothetical protein AAB522_00275 [Patescibacteria group bacterium]